MRQKSDKEGRKMNGRGKKEREEAGGEIMKKGGQSRLTDQKSLFYAFNIP